MTVWTPVPKGAGTVTPVSVIEEDAEGAPGLVPLSMLLAGTFTN